MIQDISQAYPFLLEKALRHLRHYSQREFQRLGYNITIDQWVVLYQIALREGRSVKALSEATDKDPASLTRILDLLEAEQWVARRPHPSDRRTLCLYLSVQGRTVVDALAPVAAAIRDKGLEGLPDDTLHMLRTTLLHIQQQLPL